MDKFFAELRTGNMSGAEKFLAVAIGSTQTFGDALRVADCQKAWPAHVMNGGYSPAYFTSAQKQKWVTPVRNGSFKVTQRGMEHFSGLADPIKGTDSALIVFSANSSHSFDETLRKIFEGASEIRIADSYVDETIFGTTLGSIPTTASIKLLYGRVHPPERQTDFDARVKRFRGQYSRFEMKTSKTFHDRLLVVDEVGYLLGPSLKDAAGRKPALLAKLNARDSKQLTSFFDDLWIAAA